MSTSSVTSAERKRIRTEVIAWGIVLALTVLLVSRFV